MIALTLGWVGSTVSPARAVAVANVPNPREVNGGWVTDLAELLSDEAEQQLNQIIVELKAENGSEIAVVTVLDTKPSATPKAFATELFNAWGIGTEAEDNGVLFLVSKNERRTEIETGYGVESRLPDAQVGQILRNQVTPQFKQGNFEVGILGGVTAISARLQQGQASGASVSDHPASKVSQFSPTGLEVGWRARWLTPSNFFVLVILAAYGLSQRLKLPSPLGLMAPTGRTEVAPRNWVYDAWLVMLCSLGCEGSNGMDYHPLPMQELAERRLAQGLGWLGCGIVFAATLFFASASPVLSLRLSLLALGWFGLEIGLSYATAVKRRGFSKASIPLGPFFAIAAQPRGFRQAPVSIIGTVFVFLIFAFSLLLSLLMGTWVLGLPCGVLVTLALALRSRRQQFAAPCCKTCVQRDGLKAPKLKVLSSAELHPHLSLAQQTAGQLETMQYEACYCIVCNPFSAAPTDGFQVHFFSNRLLRQGFKDCPTCKVPTLEVESFKAVASKTTDGSWRIKKRCHCCDYQTEETGVVKYSEPTKQLSLSRSSGSGAWGGSYLGGGYSGGSSGSGSYGGGDFGGGESGGGGAGEGW